MSDTATVLEQTIAIATIGGDRAPPALTVLQQTIAVATRAEQGPAGRPGRDAAGAFQERAGRDLSGHRAVRVGPDGRLAYASCLIPGEAISVLGLVDGAAEEGALATIISSGPLDEPSWSWVPGQPVWLGVNGALVQPQPNAGDLRQVGIAITPTRIAVAIGSLILRA